MVLRAVLPPLAALGLLLLSPGPARAAIASGAPLSLLPGGQAPPIAVPAPTPPATAPLVPIAPGPQVPVEPAAPSAPMQQIAPAPGTSGSAIDFRPLAAPDPGSLGLLTEGHGGLPATLWQGTSRATVDRLLALLGPSPSPAAERLSRRLLLSAVAAPAGTPVPETGGAPSLLALRIARLNAIGDARDAAALAALAPPNFADPAFLRAAADADWLTGKDEAACALARIALARLNETYWDIAGAFCRAEAGQKAEARLTLDLLREGSNPAKSDPGTTGPSTRSLELLGLVAGESEGRLKSLKDPSALDLAMLKASRRAPPADILDGAQPATLAFVAGLEKAPLDLRLEAAERAVAYGALEPPELASLYGKVKFTARELREVKARPRKEKTPDPRADALLYRQITSALKAATPDPARLAELLDRAAQPLYGPKGLSPLIRTLGPALVQLAPDPALERLAPRMARILLILGQDPQAKAWFGLVKAAAAGGDATAQADAARLWALFVLADPVAPAAVDPADLRRWWNAGPADQGQQTAQAALLYVLLDALGHPVPPVFWSHLYAPSLSIATEEPSPAILRGLRVATADGRVGETLAFALLALGPGGSATADGTTLAAVITGLGRIGLAGEAHNLALEAALANGF